MGRMADGRLQHWFCSLLVLLILLKTEGFFVDITYVQNAVAKGAVCLDGSPPAYHLDRGFGAGINNWLVHIEGGGWCNNVTTCLARKNTSLGSSKQMEKQVAFEGILSNKEKFNPDFYNWNRIKVRYCDGASFTGDVEAVTPATNLHFRGARVFLAVMEDLLAKGMKNAENAVLSGCSAGGLASIIHCDSFRALLPIGTKVKCFADAGLFINAKDISGTQHIEAFHSEVVETHGSAKNLAQTCTSRLKPSLCFFPQYMAQQIQTPLFIVNAAYDWWQIQNILAPGVADPHGTWQDCKLAITNCSPGQLQTMQAFRAEFLNALSGLGPSTSRGLFINSCYAHYQTEMQETWLRDDSPVLDNKTIAKAVGDWFYERSPFQKIDCPYPCYKTCHVFYSQENPMNNNTNSAEPASNHTSIGSTKWMAKDIKKLFAGNAENNLQSVRKNSSICSIINRFASLFCSHTRSALPYLVNATQNSDPLGLKRWQKLLNLGILMPFTNDEISSCFTNFFILFSTSRVGSSGEMAVCSSLAYFHIGGVSAVPCSN